MYHRAADAPYPDAVGYPGTGGAAAGRGAVLRLVLVAVPTCCIGASRGFPDRRVAGPAGLPAPGCRRVHAVGRPWGLADHAPIFVALRLRLDLDRLWRCGRRGVAVDLAHGDAADVSPAFARSGDLRCNPECFDIPAAGHPVRRR